MQDDDEIVRKIQEASERYQPTYDDASWADMQRLLDEHLPQKKNKRRIIYLILLTLIPLAGLYIATKFKNPGNSPSTANSASTASSQSILKVPEKNQLQQPAAADQMNNAQLRQGNAINNLSRQKGAIKITGTAASYILNPSFAKHVSLVKNQSKNTAITIAQNSPATVAGEKASDKTNTVETGSPLPASITADILNADKADSIQNKAQPKVSSDINKEDTSKNKTIATTTKKDNSHFKHYWIIGAAMGPDVSAVKLDNAGKITLQYGVQLGYAISQRFTLHTGFFISKKLYSVGADDYHAQGSYYNNYLQTVDADCKVYEIPLMVSYKFAGTKKGGWFASAGISSYFMKKESYDYFYKYPGGTTYTNNYTVSNKNKHYFSIMDFSAGYEFALNKKVTIAAEPYMKLPVTGIGVGKIKLNSGGILFSVNVKPFR